MSLAASREFLISVRNHNGDRPASSRKAEIGKSWNPYSVALLKSNFADDRILHALDISYESHRADYCERPQLHIRLS